MRIKIHAFLLGVKEGLQNPYTEVGLTWTDLCISEAFDRGLNVGSNICLFVRSLHRSGST